MTALAHLKVFRGLRGVDMPQFKLRIDYRSTGLLPRDLRLERDGRTITLVFDPLARNVFLAAIRRRLPAILYWFQEAGPEVLWMTMTGEDGNDPTLARFTASGRRPGQVAIPDDYWFTARGYARQRREALASPVPWHERSDELVWRGGYNGLGRFSLEQADQWDQTVNQRFRAVAVLRGVAGTDVKLHELGYDEGAYVDYARAEHYFGDPLPEPTWLGRKYALDLDGTVNTWSNLYIRMLYGCCVLKVQSPFGWFQWYYDRLRPFEHYVPVAADLGDLREKLDWVRSHPAEAEAIAANARAFAHGYSFEDSRREAGEIIRRHWQQPTMMAARRPAA